jgi:hypothetical protein
MPQNVSSTTPAVVAPSSVGTFPSGAINTPPNAVIRHGGYAVPFSPVMRSKSPARSVRVGPPDFSGMRERRTESEMTVSQLQQLRGVKRTGETTPSAGWTTTVSSMGQQAWETLTGVFSFEIGPPGSAAASVSANVPALVEFQTKFSKDFEIWLSPSASQCADLKGMVIVIGENHYDPAIQASVKQVMMGFRRTRGDRFLIEGGKDVGCDERVRKYLLEPDDCRLLESDSSRSRQLTKQSREMLSRLRACVDYLREHLPSARKPLAAENLQTYSEFIRRHAKDLPPSAVPGFNVLVSASNKAVDQLTRDAKSQQPARDKEMAKAVRTELNPDARNYVVVGAYHLHPLRDHLRDLPCVFMLPRAMAGQAELPSLRETAHEDL